MNKEKNTLKINTKDKISFANEYSYYKLFWIFLIGSIAGVFIETSWYFFLTGNIESRTALVLGPFNPIYGLGAIITTILYIILKDKNTIVIFIASMILGGVFETFCSFMQELIFGTVSWYYDADSLGILGKRTSIIYCILWGILGIIWIKYVYPMLEKYIEKIPNRTGKILTWSLTIFLIFNILLSSSAVYRQRERRNKIPANNKFRKYLDTRYNDDILKKIYPNMTVIK